MYPARVPRPIVLKNVIRLARRPIPVFSEYIERYGDNFIISVGATRTTHFTVDAEVARHVLQRNHRNYEKSEIQTVQMGKYLGFGLLTNNGEDWLRQRRLIQPGFHRKRLARLVEVMQQVIEKECSKIGDGQPFDLFKFTRNAAFNIIVRAIFTDGYTEEETHQLHETLDRIQEYIIYPIRLPFLRGPLRWLGKEQKHLELAQVSRRLVLQQIQARRAPGATQHDDLLQMLLDSRYEDTGEAMDDERLIDEIIILFAAGYETSANALAWTLWLLLQHPQELQKARAEVDQLKASGPIGFHNAGELTYLTQIIEESMRLYPPAWITDRIALGPDEAHGYEIDTGITIGIFIYGIHHSSAYYEEPAEFRPERMHADAKKERHPFSFMPFGGGPRLCIGNHFAMLEMQLLLAHLISGYELEAVGQLPDLDPTPYITLHQDKPVKLRARPRS